MAQNGGAPKLRFTFRDLYPGAEGPLTVERTVQDVEDKAALGISVIQRVEEENRRNNGRKILVLFVLIFLLVLFRYI